MIKLIRLRIEDIASDLQIGVTATQSGMTPLGKNLKVVVLFRDPRAILNSMMMSPDSWGEKQNIDNICGNIVSNFEAIHELDSMDKIRV